MATYTSNYGWTKPSGSDNVDISVLNNNLDNQDSVIHNAFLNMAVPFSELSTYAVDDIVLYDTGLYKCHTPVVTPGAWTGSTNWQVYKLSEGGGGGLTLGETSSTAYRGDRGKTAYDHSQLTSGNPHNVSKTDVGLGNVPNVSTNDQTPTFSEASTRNNIASGEKLSVILGKIQKFFNDLKSVAYSGSYTDLSSQPQINSNTLSGNKTTSDLGINADNVMMSDGVTSVGDAVGDLNNAKQGSDYTVPTLIAGTSYDHGCGYCRIGCFVVIFICVQFSAVPTNVRIFTVPAGYKPICTVELAASGQETYNAKAQATVDANGEVYVSSSDKYINAYGIYVVKP